MKTITGNNLTWIDIEKPTKQDMEWLKSNFHIKDDVIDEIVSPSSREKIEHFDGFLFLIMFLPIFHRQKRTTRPTEFDVLITKNQLITIHNKPIEPLNDFIEKCEKKADLKLKYFSLTTGHLFYWLCSELLNFAERQLTHIGEKIDKVEDNVFTGAGRELIKEISIIKRDILDFRVSVRPFYRIFNALANRGNKFWAEESEGLKIYFNDLICDYERIWGEVDNFTATINALEDTHTNLLSNKTNNIIKTFTILSFTTFPAMLVSAILAVNSQDRYIIFGVILFTTTFIWSYFKMKKWI